MTVVLVHGFTLTSQSWVFQRRALRAAGYRVVLYDQRGHGRSGQGAPGSYTIEQLGRDLGTVVRAAAPTGPVVLVGHSMGGMSLMSFAQECPQLLRERVIGAGFLATSAGGLKQVRWGLAPGMSTVIQRIGPRAVAHLTGREALVASALRLTWNLDSRVVRQFSFHSPVPRSVVRHTTSMIMSTPPAVISGFSAGLLSHDRSMALATFEDIETLVLIGSRDRLTPLDHSATIAAALPRAEHVVIERAGHVLMLEYPDLVNDHLMALVRRAQQASGHPASLPVGQR